MAPSPDALVIRNAIKIAADVDRIGDRAEKLLRQAAVKAARGLTVGAGPATRKALRAQLAQIYRILDGAGVASYEQFVSDLEKRISPWTKQSAAEVKATIQTGIDDGLIAQGTSSAGAAAGMTSSQVANTALISQTALRNAAAMGPIELTVIGSKKNYSLGREFARAFLEPDGSTTQQAFDKAVRGLEDKFDVAVKSAVVSGQTTQDLVKELIGDGKQAPGAIDPILRQVNAAARTGAQHVANAVQSVQLNENEMVDFVRYSATLDQRTSPICRALDGKVYKKGDSPQPPLHWNCRSTLVAHVPGRERGSRSMTMAVVEDGKIKYRGAYGDQSKFTAKQKDLLAQNRSGIPPTYDDWLKAQPAAAQQAILGRKGAERFQRNGSLTRSASPATKRKLAQLPDPVPASRQRAPVPGTKPPATRPPAPAGSVPKSVPAPKPKTVKPPKKELEYWSGDDGYKEVRAEEFRQAKAAGVKLNSYEQQMIKDYPRTKQATEATRKLEAYLNSDAPRYKGTIYRGMNLEQSELNDLMKRYQSGGQAYAIESWTKSNDTAGFDFMIGGGNPVMLKVVNKRGVDIQQYSKVQEEAEVLMPKDVRYKIKDVKKINFSPSAAKLGIYEYQIELEQLDG